MYILSIIYHFSNHSLNPCKSWIFLKVKLLFNLCVFVLFFIVESLNFKWIIVIGQMWYQLHVWYQRCLMVQSVYFDTCVLFSHCLPVLVPITCFSTNELQMSRYHSKDEHESHGACCQCWTAIFSKMLALGGSIHTIRTKAQR